ncbi:hypothetical protein RFI_20164, partial [Reticulomyxa filosa]
IWINYWSKWYWPFLRDHNKNEQDSVVPFLRRQVYDTIYDWNRIKDTEDASAGCPTNHELELLNSLNRVHNEIDELGMEIHMMCHLDEQTKIDSKFIQSLKKKLSLFIDMVDTHMSEEEQVFFAVLPKLVLLTEKEW